MIENIEEDEQNFNSSDDNKLTDFNSQNITLSDYMPKKRKGFIYFWYLVIKRIFDFLSALLVSILLFIPMLIVAFAVMVKDFGNPFYKQKRIGKNGKTLKIWKFRSMKKGADNLQKMLTPEQYQEYLKEYKLDDDPRLIGYKKEGDGKNGKCFGAEIRRTSIDELPQILFNICILGNMSVVGPRPMLNEELDRYYTLEQKELLLTAKPGLTGYWQAYARNNATYASGKRQEMELYYIEHRSVWLDIKIIFKTFISVLKHTGAKIIKFLIYQEFYYFALKCAKMSILYKNNYPVYKNKIYIFENHVKILLT